MRLPAPGRAARRLTDTKGDAMKPRYFFVVWRNARGALHFRHAVPCTSATRPTLADIGAALAAELAAEGIPTDGIRVCSARETVPGDPITEQPANPALP